MTQQNLATTSTEALAQEGKAVRLIWKRQHELPVADGAALAGGEEETSMKHRRFLALAAVAALAIGACSGAGRIAPAPEPAGIASAPARASST